MEKEEINEIINESYITLIPKKNKDQTRIENLRSISLLEVHRKIITKAMSWRLKTNIPR